METIFCKNRDDWRDWLDKNYNQTSEIWLIYFKKHTKKESVKYNEAVEEALCFGWIDSQVKSIDKDTYMQKYTPRKKNSVWSLVNKNRAEKLIKEKKMTKAGFEQIEIAKNNGNWENAYSSKVLSEIPEEIFKTLENNSIALNNFYKMSSSHQNAYIGWILMAKRNETKEKRIAIVIDRLEKNLKPGYI
ncbi:MAG: hypothetical protein A2041_04365 [Bacteroidetes bacterium GWA2_31_9b]|nr:MAG: hypothetical protein A2041_04365 [Bacteroidetes bacterium GWA2_31_9b]